MAENSSTTGKLILVPALITLVITLLRVYGELHYWSPVFFSRAAGGGLAVVGITWLPIFFGPYFALKLARAGNGPTSMGKSFLFTLVGLVVFVGGSYLAFSAGPGQISTKGLLAYLVMLVGALVTLAGWPALTKTLFAYGYAARIPVAIVMYAAIQGSWGTHYDALPPGYPPDVAFWTKYIGIGLLPQFVLWIAFTVIVGSLFGGIAAAIAGRGKTAEQSA
ncbi:MAG TPA: hypothetical protein VGW33_14655 [Terriglobia bacterium]|nr:hypothetical protein [Terriglobia bacterium]